MSGLLMGAPDVADWKELSMLDCYYAPDPHRPFCDREGYFINGFEDALLGVCQRLGKK